MARPVFPRSRDTTDLPTTAPRPLPRDADPGARWRFRRNLVIYLAHRQGLSQAFIADAFTLSRSLVRKVIQDFARYEESVLVRPRHGRRAHDADPVPIPASRLGLPPHWSASRCARWRRDQVIKLAHRQGLSKHFLADVFDLPRSRVIEILRGDPDPDPAAPPRDPGIPKARRSRTR